MTTIVYDRRTKTIVADTQNTDSSGAIFRTPKIEKLSNGGYFLGSGHCLPIGLARRWAETNFAETHRPDFTAVFDKPDEFGFSCLVVSKDGNSVMLIDDETEPMVVLDAYMGVGSGCSYALGAMDAGATAQEAVAIASQRDCNTSGPFDVVEIR